MLAMTLKTPRITSIWMRLRPQRAALSRTVQPDDGIEKLSPHLRRDIGLPDASPRRTTIILGHHVI